MLDPRSVTLSKAFKDGGNAGVSKCHWTYCPYCPAEEQLQMAWLKGFMEARKRA
jgi:ribosome modulation factor